MTDLFIFEGDGVLWDAKGSVFERKFPLTKKDRFTLIDAEGAMIMLDKDVFEVFSFLRRKGKRISISRYYQEEEIIGMLRRFGIKRYMSFIEVVWDKEKGTYQKTIRDAQGNQEVLDQSRINFIEGRSAYLSLVGNAFFDHRMLDNAEAAYQEAMDLDPENHAAILGLAKIQYEKGKLDDALRLFRIIEEKIINPDIYYGIAKVFQSRSDSDQAKRYLKETINKDPNDPKAYHDLLRLYLNEKDMESAKRLMKKAVEMVPKNKGASIFKKELFRLCKVLPDG